MGLGLHVGVTTQFLCKWGINRWIFCGCAPFFWGEKPWCTNQFGTAADRACCFGEDHVANVVERLKSLKKNKGHYVSCIIYHTLVRLSKRITMLFFWQKINWLSAGIDGQWPSPWLLHIKVWTASITDVSTTRCWRGWDGLELLGMDGTGWFCGSLFWWDKDAFCWA